MIHYNTLTPWCPIKFLPFKNIIYNIIHIAYTLRDLVIDIYFHYFNLYLIIESKLDSLRTLNLKNFLN